MFPRNDTQMDDTVMTSRTPGAPLPNREFAPPCDRLPARWPFDGVLAIEGGELAASDDRVQGHAALGGRPDRFPRVDLGFVTDGETLVPVHCGLHRKPDPESYWDIMAGEGCIWSTQGGDGPDRACFPFQLSCERENDSHHGLARFSWDGRRVTDLVVQVVTETLPDHLPERLDLWGGLEAAFRGPARPAGRHDPWLLHGIEELEDRVPRHLMEALLKDPFRESEIVSGLAMDGRIYTTGIRTRHGPWPFPYAMRFGIWSATKAAFGTTALMRLACHLGPDVAETRITDVLDITARHDGWNDVTIRNCLDMATGIGTAGRDPEPVDIYADNLTQPGFRLGGRRRDRKLSRLSAVVCCPKPRGQARRGVILSLLSLGTGNVRTLPGPGSVHGRSGDGCVVEAASRRACRSLLHGRRWRVPSGRHGTGGHEPHP